MTLVELLASVMVASIIMVALLQTLTSASVSWTQQSKNFSAQREGRVAMRILADDLAAMVLVPQWAREAVVSTPVSPTGTPGGGLDDNRTGYRVDPAQSSQDSSRLMFLRATEAKGDGANTNRGDLCLVMYGLALVSDSSASGLTSQARSQKLVRRVLSPAETFRRLKRHLEASLPMATNADWEALEEMRFEPGIADSGVVAHDVIRFELRPFADVRSTSAPSAIPDWQPSKWMDVTLRVTNRQTGQFLETEGEWRGGGERGQLLLNGTSEVYHDDPEVKTYTMRLRMPSHML
jgi:type II secretory pathway pseudopilin PulG